MLALSMHHIVRSSTEKSNQIVSNVQERQDHRRKLSYIEYQISIDVEFGIGLCCVAWKSEINLLLLSLFKMMPTIELSMRTIHLFIKKKKKNRNKIFRPFLLMTMSLKKNGLREVDS